MDIVSWKESYSVGNEQIDHEHMVFIKIISRIHIAVTQEKPVEDIKRLLNELEKYAALYFVSEENIMIDSDFPYIGEHRKEHEKLLQALAQKMQQITSGEEHPRLIVSFLIDWFVEHTTSRDLDLARHLDSAN